MPSALMLAIQTALNSEDPIERLRLSLAAASVFRHQVKLESLAAAILSARGADAIAATLGETPGDVAARLVALSEDDQDRVESLLEESR